METGAKLCETLVSFYRIKGIEALSTEIHELDEDRVKWALLVALIAMGDGRSKITAPQFN